MLCPLNVQNTYIRRTIIVAFRYTGDISFLDALSANEEVIDIIICVSYAKKSLLTQNPRSNKRLSNMTPFIL